MKIKPPTKAKILRAERKLIQLVFNMSKAWTQEEYSQYWLSAMRLSEMRAAFRNTVRRK